MDYTLSIAIPLSRTEELSLDLAKITSQVSNMIARLRDTGEERQQRLRRALDIISNEVIDLDELRRKIATSKTSWLVAELVEGLANHYATPPIPPEFTVMATDGSHIDVDRHRTTRCYLINIGSVKIDYGSEPAANLDSFPHLYSSDEDLVITPPGIAGRDQMVEGTLLGIKRGVEECRHLVKPASELPQGSVSLALLDGTLILWGLEAYPDFVTDELLVRGFLSCLDDLRKFNKDRKLALASYISFPRSTDVVNVLRLAICPHQPADCDRFCPTNRDCDVVAGVRDRDLFFHLLSDGERSALFISPSKIVKKYYGSNQIYFFYVKLADEVARVEIPEWVAADSSLLDLTHALVLDQCRRGHGYPVVLSEAHEQAVVTAADRENFWQMVESSLVEEKLPTLGSAKSFSKRTRWV